MRPFLLLMSGAISATALAQLDFADDFETGNFSRWAQVMPAKPGSTIQVAGAAAHRGGFGVRLIDGYTAAGTGGDVALHNGLPTDGGVRDVFLRSWIRRVSSNAVNGSRPNFLVIQGTGLPSYTLAEIYLDNSGLVLDRFDISDAYAEVMGSRGLDAGAWSLVELSALRVGTANGSAHLFVDGAEIATLTGIDWSGAVANQYYVGEGWGYLPFLGTLDFDDARVSASAPASRLQLAVPSSAVAGECVPVNVSLWASTGVGAQAPYAVDVTIANDGGLVQLLADDCASAVAAVRIDAGASSAAARVRLAEGVQLLTAAHTDFMAGEAALAVGPDAGSALLARAYDVGCGCSSSAATPLLLAIGLFAWRRRQGHAKSLRPHG